MAKEDDESKATGEEENDEEYDEEDNENDDGNDDENDDAVSSISKRSIAATISTAIDEFPSPKKSKVILKKIATRSGFLLLARPFVQYFPLVMILLSIFLQRQLSKWKLTLNRQIQLQSLSDQSI